MRHLKNFLTDEKAFFKDTSIVFSGKVLIAILAFITTPILTRLFTPEAYGVFALYNSIITNFVVLGTLALPAALNTAKKELLSRILLLTLLVIGVFTLCLTTVGFLLERSILASWSLPTILSSYWYLIPLGFLLSASSQSLSALQLRLKEFKLTTKVSVTESITAKSSNLINGFLKMGGLGLVISDLLAKFIGLVILVVKLPRQLVTREDISRQILVDTLKTVKDYPLFVMPAQWVSILSTQLILWFIAYQYSTSDLGKYVIALSLLNIPLHILSNSFQPIITQRLVDSRDNADQEFSITKLLGLLGIISFTVFGIIFLIPQAWFVYFLGDQWQGVGLIIKLLCTWNFVLFLDQSINNGFVVFDKQRQKLYVNLIDLGLQVGVLAIAAKFSIELQQFILFFAIAKVAASIARIFYIYLIAGSSTKPKRIT